MPEHNISSRSNSEPDETILHAPYSIARRYVGESSSATTSSETQGSARARQDTESASAGLEGPALLTADTPFVKSNLPSTFPSVSTKTARQTLYPRALDAANYDFRFIILSGNPDPLEASSAPYKCQLEYGTLLAPPVYTALSYGGESSQNQPYCVSTALRFLSHRA